MPVLPTLSTAPFFDRGTSPLLRVRLSVAPLAQMDYLTRLPTELLQCISTFPGPSPCKGSRVLGPRDLASLMRTHSRLYAIVLPILYVHNRDVDESTAVVWAAQNGCLGTLELAWSFRLSLEAKRPLRGDLRRGIGLWRSGIHHAIENGHSEAVTWLIDHGAKTIEYKTNSVVGGIVEGSSAFETALEFGRLEIALSLVEKGAAQTLSPFRQGPVTPPMCVAHHPLYSALIKTLESHDPLALPDFVEEKSGDLLGCATTDQGILRMPTVADTVMV